MKRPINLVVIEVHKYRVVGRDMCPDGIHLNSTGISFLASRRLRGYTCLPPVWPSAHNIFPQMVPLAPFRPSGVLKTNALPASGSVFSDTAACRGSLRINFSAAKAELPRGHWQPSNPPHHRRKQPPCQMALRQQ